MQSRKTIFILLAAAILFSGCKAAKYVPEEERRIERTISIAGASKNELYLKANAWFVEAFNSAESVIEYQDKEDGAIMGKYILSMPYDVGYNLFTSSSLDYNIRQVILVEVREEAVRIRIRNPYYQFGKIPAFYPLSDQDKVDALKKRWVELIYEFEAYLKADN
jgi:hypothetical protein